MKINLIGPFPPPYGGMFIHMEQLKGNLEQNGIICGKVNTSNRLSKRQKKCFSIFRKTVIYLAAVTKVVCKKADVCHIHTGSYSSFWAGGMIALFARLFRRKCVMSIHGGAFPQFVRCQKAMGTRMLQYFLNIPDSIICISNPIFESLVSLGISPEKLSVISPFLSGQTIPDVGIPTGIGRFMEQHSPVFCSVVFFEPIYDAPTMIRAVEMVKGSYPGLGLVILGSGTGERELRKLIESLHMDNSVLMPGNLSHEECLATMKRSDLFIRPTLVDADSISVREALNMGLPVIASDTDFRPSGTVLFKKANPDDLAEKILTVLGGEHSVKRESASAQHHADNFQRILTIYTRLTELNMLRRVI